MVQEACVVGIPVRERGETAKAFVVLREGEEASAEEIISWSKEQMAAYKYPRQIEFVGSPGPQSGPSPSSTDNRYSGLR